MRIFIILIISIMSISISYLYAAVPTDCTATSDISASAYLKLCAQWGWSDNAIDPSKLWDGVTAIHELVKNTAKTVLAFGSLFAIGAIVFSGIQYTTSYGDDEKVKKAKTTGVYAIIGLLLLLLAFPLVDIVVNFIYSLS